MGKNRPNYEFVGLLLAMPAGTLLT
jgi:hypothetical protein